MKKSEKQLLAAELEAQLYRPLAVFEKMFGHHVMSGSAPRCTKPVTKYEVLQLRAAFRMLRKHSIDSLLMEWARWNLLPLKERWRYTPKDKRELFIWMDKVLMAASFGLTPGDVERAQCITAVVYVLRAYLVVNVSKEQRTTPREDFEQANFDQLVADDMQKALQEVEQRCRQVKKRKAVRRGHA